MAKIKWIFLNIISLGGVYFYARFKAKKQSEIVNEKITTSEKLTFDIKILIKALGGTNNISMVESNISTVKIGLKDMSLINDEILKTTKLKGMMKAQNDITIVYGNNSAFIAEQIKKIL